MSEPRVITINKKIGALLKESRCCRSLSLLEVAEFLNLEPEILSNYEEGSVGIPLCHIYKLLDFLGIDAGTLLAVINECSFPEIADRI